MGRSAREINEEIDQAVAAQLATPRIWEHPRYVAGTWVKVDQSILSIHPQHLLAGKTVRVCHGDPGDYPCVPLEISGETNLFETYTTGNASLVPELYVLPVR